MRFTENILGQRRVRTIRGETSVARRVEGLGRSYAHCRTSGGLRAWGAEASDRLRPALNNVVLRMGTKTRVNNT